MNVRRVLVILFVGLLAIGGLIASRIFDPVIGFPGGRLTGNEQPKPADWSSTAAVSTLQLETRPENPYSVNVWGVGIGSDFYVSTHAEGTAWSRKHGG